MRALITGITGFAGSHLAEHLVAAGDEVLGIAHARAWPDDVPQTIRHGVPLVPWDLGDPDGLSEASRRRIEQFAPQAVYHLAALSIPALCGKSRPTERAWAVNVEGTARILELARRIEPRPRLLLVSSNKVYAPPTRGPAIVSEDDPCDPRNGYGQTKLAAEKLVLQAADGQIEAVVARSFQHAGPRQDASLMLSEWAWQFAACPQGPVRIRTRRARLDLSDVRDVVRAYRLLMLQGASGAVYNVGSGIARFSGEVFDLLHRLADPNRPVVEQDPRAIEEPIANISRLEQATGWQPEIPLDQTVADTWRYWQAQATRAARGDQPAD